MTDVSKISSRFVEKIGKEVCGSLEEFARCNLFYWKRTRRKKLVCY